MIKPHNTFYKSAFFLLIHIFLSFGLFSFPESVKHGYVNCTACHISPSGGGILTPYGRSLSKEIFSTFGVDGEERYLYFINTPEWLSLGGDFRHILLSKSSANITNITMQRDIELAVEILPFTLVGTFGYRDPTSLEKNTWFSRRHYLLYKYRDEYMLRAGRFFPAFGLYIPDHATVIRRGLVWDEGMESYNVELSYIGEKINFQATAVLGRPDMPKLYRETGGAGLITYHPGDSYKLGASYYYGASDLISHHIWGPYGVVGISPRLSLLAQINGTRTFLTSREDPQWGWVDYMKLDYEWYQGLHTYLTQEFSEIDYSQKDTRKTVYGIGLQIFPRPHFELQLYYQKKYSAGIFASDVVALYLHFYP